MQDYNRVTILGNVTKDPEQRSFQNGGSVVTFSVATNERWNDRTSGEKKERSQFHNIAVFDEAKGEVAMRFLHKGSRVLIEGQLETRSFEKDGQTRYVTEVAVRPFSGGISLQDTKAREAAKPTA
jgi:single-strand DNA-binding protein